MSESQSQTSGPEFRHEPLDHHTNSIRLVRILHESNSGHISCTMIHTTIHASDYICLSYQWGSKKGRREIYINGARFIVRRNLYDFLSTVSRSEPDMNLYWIDALCIDQENSAERNHQVQQMGSIFSSASGVIVWLGPITDQIRPLLSALFSRLIQSDSTQKVYKYKWSSDHALLREETFDGNDEDKLLNFLSWNEYWYRAWVTQEIILAKRVLVQLDDSLVEYKDLLLGLMYFRSFDTEDRIGRIGRFRQDVPLGLYGLRETDHLEARGTPLLSLLGYFGKRRCEVPRDNVYSLLSMSKEADTISVDYRTSSLDVLIDVLTKDQSQSLCACTVSLLWECLELPDENRARELQRAGFADEDPVLDLHIHDFGPLQETEYLRINKGKVWRCLQYDSHLFDPNESTGDCKASRTFVDLLLHGFTISRPLHDSRGRPATSHTLRPIPRPTNRGWRASWGLSVVAEQPYLLHVRLALWALAALNKHDYTRYCKKLPWGTDLRDTSRCNIEYSINYGHWDLRHNNEEHDTSGVYALPARAVRWRTRSNAESFGSDFNMARPISLDLLSSSGSRDTGSENAVVRRDQLTNTLHSAQHARAAIRDHCTYYTSRLGYHGPVTAVYKPRT